MPNINFNYLNKKNNTPTINKFFKSDYKINENKIGQNNRFENLFLGNEDNEEENEIRNNFSRLNERSYITNTNAISSKTDKTFESRKSSIELLFNS